MKKESLEQKIQRLEETVKTLKTVEDIENIKQLQYRYINCVIFAKWDEIVDCFMENSVVDIDGIGVMKGKAEIEKLFSEKISIVHYGKEGDFLAHPIISVDGDKAKGNWLFYMMYFHPRTWQSLFWVQGIYNMEYVKCNGQWKISLLKFGTRLEPPECFPTPDFLNNFLKS